MKINNKVLHITPFFYPNVGGVETHLLDLLKITTKKYMQIVVTYQPLVGSKKSKEYEKSENLEVYRVGHIKNLFYKTVNFPALHFLYLTPILLFQCWKVISRQSNQISVIHAHGVNAGFIAYFLGRLFSIDYILSFHVDFHFQPDGISTKIYRKIVSGAKNIFVLTNHSKDELVKFGIQDNKIINYSYWVDQDVFIQKSKTECRKDLQLDLKRFVVLFVGRLSRQKGVDKILKVSKTNKNIDFVVVGEGELQEEVRHASDAQKNLHYYGRVENENLPKYYSAADVTIVPSESLNPKPTFVEGVPRVIIESISCGTPVMGTDSGGMKEVILDGMIGFFIDDSVGAIESKIKKLVNNRKILKTVSKRCRKYAKEKFGSKNSQVFLNVYENQTKLRQLSRLLRNTGDLALRRRTLWLIDRLKLKPDDKILDAGCGDGFFLHLISEIEPKTILYGFDFDKNAINSAKKNLLNKKINYSQGDLMKRLPYKDNFFDKIFMSEVVEHLPNDQKGLKEIYRVLKPGGMLLITVPSSKYPFLWDPINWTLEKYFSTHIKSGFFAGIWNQHERLYTKDQISKVVRSAGFKITEKDYQTWWCLPFNHYIINLGARMIAGDLGPKVLSAGGSKFNPTESRTFLTSAYFWLAEKVDYLNNLFPVQSKGFSIVVKAVK